MANFSVMGMDWHSSGITTSVMGALKRGLNPRPRELGIYICGGRGRHSRNTPDELRAVAGRTRPRWRSAGAHQPPDGARRQQRHRRRLPDLPAHLRRDARRRVGGRAAGHERGEPAWRAAITGTRRRSAISPASRTPAIVGEHAGDDPEPGGPRSRVRRRTRCSPSSARRPERRWPRRASWSCRGITTCARRTST